jgi:hypothetical protein
LESTGVAHPPPGPFPNRPKTDVDAEVIVATSPDGYEGEVQRFNAEGEPTSTSSLLYPNVVFSNNQVQVFVPARYLPSTSAPGTAVPKTHYSYVFWAGTSPSVPKGIAGFAPEYMDTSVVATYFRSS